MNKRGVSGAGIVGKGRGRTPGEGGRDGEGERETEKNCRSAEWKAADRGQRTSLVPGPATYILVHWKVKPPLFLYSFLYE